MTDKTIKELIEEAQEFARRQSNQVLFGILPGHLTVHAVEEGPCTVYDGCPAVDIPPTQPEDRMLRIGVIPFEVGIFDDDGLVSTLQVHATSALDARCIAYIIDRGRKMQQWGDEQIDLALACTEVVG